MINIYIPTNTNFTNNGNAVLFPITCKVSAALNGAWLLEMEVPIDDEERWKRIEVGAVIKAPSFNGDQLFRIGQTQKQDSGIGIVAEPIFLDAVGDCFLLDNRIVNKNGQQALDDILSANSKYTGRSDITRTATAYYVRKNAMEAIAGEEESSFLNRWGGEILYNNYEIIVANRIGADNGVELLYGKNIPTDGLTEAVNMEEVTTRIVPKAYNGHILPGDSPWVDSPLINTYPTVMTRVAEYDHIRLASDVEGEEPEEGVIICDTLAELHQELRNAANESFEAGVDKPIVTIEADMVMLGRTVEYQDFKDLEKVSLGDTIHCKHNRLGIVTDARVVSLVYDCINKAVESITIGEIQPSFMDRVAITVTATEKAITKGGAVKAEQIEGFINGALAQLRLQNTVAKRQDVRAILFEDLDPASPTYGALAIGTQGWQISKQRTIEGNDWVWTTAATSGGIIADTINAGTLEAIDIQGVNITGSSISGNTISGGTISGTTITGTTIDGNTITGGTISGSSISGNTISGGTISGTTITGTTINGNTISGGTISGTDISGSTITSTEVNGNVTRVASLDNGEILFSQTNSQYPAVNSTTEISGGGLTFENPNAGIATRTTVGGGIYVRLLSDLNQYGRVSYNTIEVAKTQRDRTQIQSGKITTLENDVIVWQNTFSAGNTAQTGEAMFSGHITNSTKWIDFYVPLLTSPVGRTVTVTLPSQLSVRGINGYVGGAQYPTWNVTATGTCLRNGIKVRLASSTAFTNATNNTPVTVHGDFTFTFS